MNLTRSFAILYLICVVIVGVFSAETSTNSTAKVEEKKCDESCFNVCSIDKDLETCGLECNCQEKAKELNIQLTKNERCWGQCRQECSLEMFTKTTKDATAAPSDCFGDCSCICNRGCTDSCKTSPLKAFCLTSCGCPNNQTVTNALLKKSEEYFKADLDPRSGDEITAEFQGKLADAVAKSTKKTTVAEVKPVETKIPEVVAPQPKVIEAQVPEAKATETLLPQVKLLAQSDEEDVGDDFEDYINKAKERYAEKRAAKEKKILNRKLQKVEERWDEYVSDATKIGVDPLVFCNQTCSHDCFLEADKSTYDILTGCLINKCQCFQPRLPKVSDKISFEALIALKNIILDEEANSNYEVTTSHTLSDVVKVTSAVESPEEKYPGPEDQRDAKEKAEARVEKAKQDATDKGEEIKQKVDDKAQEIKQKVDDKVGEIKQKSDEKLTTDKKEEIKKVVEEAGEKAKETGKGVGDYVKETAVGVKDKVVEIASKGKEKVKEIADSITGSGDNKTQTDIPPTGIPDATSGPGDSIVPPQADSLKGCNLTCFRECLDLKRFIPYPVIQQCISVRCHCNLENTSDKLEALMQMTSLEALSSLELQNKQPSLLFAFFLTALVLAILAGGATLLYMYVLDQGLRKRNFSEMDYATEPGYERLA